MQWGGGEAERHISKPSGTKTDSKTFSLEAQHSIRLLSLATMSVRPRAKDVVQISRNGVDHFLPSARSLLLSQARLLLEFVPLPLRQLPQNTLQLLLTPLHLPGACCGSHFRLQVSCRCMRRK